MVTYDLSECTSLCGVQYLCWLSDNLLELFQQHVDALHGGTVDILWCRAGSQLVIAVARLVISTAVRSNYRA